MMNSAPHSFGNSAFVAPVSKPRLQPLAGFAVCSVPHSRVILLVGGHNDATYSKDVMGYDPMRSVCFRVTTMPSPRTLLTAEILDGKLYCLGGICGLTGDIAKTGFSFDFRSGKWEDVPPMQTERAAAKMVAMDDKLWIVGGFNNVGESLNTMEYFSPEENTWIQLQEKMRSRRSFAGVAVHKSTLVVVGGYDSDPQVSLDSTEFFDFKELKWTTSSVSLLVPRAGHAVALSDGVLYAVGGFNARNRIARSEDAFAHAEELRLMDNEASWTLSNLVRLSVPRDGLGVFMHNATLCVIGGRSKTGFMSSVESFRLCPHEVARRSMLEGVARRWADMAEADDADVTILCRDGKVRAHAVVLRTVPMFEAMLRKDTFKEAKNMEIILDNQPVKVIATFVKMMYTGGTHLMRHVPQDVIADLDALIGLVRAAHYFGCPDILHGAGLLLSSRVVRNNVLQLLEVAQVLGMSDLKTACLRCIVHNFSDPAIRSVLTRLEDEDLQTVHTEIAHALSKGRKRKFVPISHHSNYNGSARR